jgi:hypothetical protein
MLEKDLNILEKILRDMNYSTSYISVLLNHLVKQLEKSSLSHFTPQFIYSVLTFEEGRHTAKQISEYFEDFKKYGSYKTSLEKTIDNSPTFSKFK